MGLRSYRYRDCGDKEPEEACLGAFALYHFCALRNDLGLRGLPKARNRLKVQVSPLDKREEKVGKRGVLVRPGTEWSDAL